ncbi:MAG: hypothetical protein M3209_08350 [Acidobacteriota bacterium]|nr:hypothetical protein [Acidobacteriota bacterium]
MSRRNTNNDAPQPFEPGEETNLPPTTPRDPVEPDPMKPDPIPVPPDKEPPVPVREPVQLPAAGDPKPAESPRIV